MGFQTLEELYKLKEEMEALKTYRDIMFIEVTAIQKCIEIVQTRINQIQG
jgi:hypothetical protein